MRWLHMIAIGVLMQVLLCYEPVLSETASPDLEKVLEDALKQIRQNQEAASETTGKTELAMLAGNLTTVLEELTAAIMNNTEEMQRRGNRRGNGNVDCEPPFFPVSSECFYVNKHKRVSWSEARNFCKGLGSDLAEPANVNMLRAMLLDMFPEDAYKFFWVGAMESGIEGNWAWISSKPILRADWALGQPDGGNENCVVLSRDDFPALHDSPCYTHTMFICEKIVLSRQ